jgi:hypothetical protein
MVDISEKSFEQTIEATLLAGGPDAYPGREGVVVEPPADYENVPGGYRKRRPEDTTRRYAWIRGWSLILFWRRNRRSGSG